MRILIFSDSHRSVNSIMQAIEREEEAAPADYIIHAGDVLSDVTELKMLLPRKNIIYVRGNNDPFARDEPTERAFELGGIRLFLTHGHNHGVKYGLYRLSAAAREKNVQVCIFGHTHRAVCEEADGILYINPGSSVSTYAVLDIADGKILTAEIKKNYAK